MKPELPRWLCHKVVRAATIRDIQWVASVNPESIGHAVITLVVGADVVPVQVGGDWLTRHRPEVGGYLVLYDDGYSSYSPAAAFESGYTRIPEE